MLELPNMMREKSRSLRALIPILLAVATVTSSARSATAGLTVSGSGNILVGSGFDDASTGKHISVSSDYNSAPLILPSTDLTSSLGGGTPVTGIVSGIGGLSTYSGGYGVGLDADLSVSGGPHALVLGLPLSVQGTYGAAYSISSDPAGVSEYYYLTVAATIYGYLAPGDSVNFSFAATTGPDMNPELLGGTITTPGNFSFSVQTPLTLIAYQFGSHYTVIGGDAVASFDGLFQAQFTKGGSGTSYIDFDPAASVSSSPSVIPEPSSSLLLCIGVFTPLACRRMIRNRPSRFGGVTS